MKLIYVIFRKDLKRFWWEAVVALGALVLLSRDDINRYDFVPGPMEGLLNFLLPLVWGYLIAALIHEEALVGNRQFWVTRPYPWPALLAAKLLSIVAFVHVPAFLADAFILLNHNFPPWNYIPQLIWKQLVLAAWVTLPSIALASVTRNIAQFFLAAIAIVTVGYFWVSMGQGPSMLWNPIDTKRATISLGAAGVVAAGLVCLQYSRRRTNLSRAGLGFAVLIAGGLYAYTPRQMLISAECRQDSGQQGVLSLRTDASVQFPPVPRSRFPAIEFRVPVRLSGLAADEQLRIEQLTLALTNNRGQRLEFNKLPRLVRIGADSFLAQLWFDRRDTGMQQVFIGRNLFPRLQSLSATLEGTVAASKYREVEVAKASVDFETRAVPGVGHCSSSVVLNSSGTGDLLRAFCESPNSIPMPTLVHLQSPSRQAPWLQFLGDGAPGGVFSWNTWLSPLNRRQTFFQIVEQRNDSPGSAWVVPREALQNATLHFSLHQPAGCEIVSYRLENVSLQRRD